MPVGRDGDQLVSGATPEFQNTPALPIGLGPVEVDGRLATREQPVVQPRIRVEPLAHEADPPCRIFSNLPCRPTSAWAIVAIRPESLHGFVYATAHRLLVPLTQDQCLARLGP